MVSMDDPVVAMVTLVINLINDRFDELKRSFFYRIFGVVFLWLGRFEIFFVFLVLLTQSLIAPFTHAFEVVILEYCD